MGGINEMNQQPNARRAAQKIKLPPLLLLIHSLAMIGIGLSIAELFPKHGQSLGLVSTKTAWTVLYISIPIVLLCMIQFVRIIRRQRAKMQR
jgi:hypothetical protein